MNTLDDYGELNPFKRKTKPREREKMKKEASQGVGKRTGGSFLRRVNLPPKLVQRISSRQGGGTCRLRGNVPGSREERA